MKKLVAMFVAVAFALSLAVLAVAAEEKKAAPAPAPAKAAEPAKKDAPKAAEPAKKAKAKAKVITGTVEALDAKAGTFSVKGKKETFALKAGEKVKLDGFKVGDKVTVTFTDGVASKVVAAKKAEKKAEPAKKEEKKAEPAKKEAAPAAPAKK